LRELEAVLKNATAADLEKHDTVALVGVVSRLTRLSEPLEKRAIELIKSYPDTLGSAVLSLLLHELRVSDDEVQRLVLAQAQRNDLPTDVWLNYSLCAFGVGFTEQGRCKARELYHQFYSPRITATPENSQRTRAWNRLTTGALFPEKLGGIRTSKRHFFGPSNFESRVVRTLRDDDELYLRDDVRIPGAPTIKAVINPDGVGKGCVVLTDSEWFTAAADEAWVKRGYKGHVHIVNKMLTEAGWHVLRIPETFAPESKQPQLCAALQQLKEYFSSQRSPTCGPLIIDPPDCFTEIANHIMLYTAKKPDSA
jgi:hypothetical protein